MVLTRFAQDESFFSAIKAGALSYLLKNADVDTVLASIIAVSRGEPILHPRIARRLMAEVHSPPQRNDPPADLT